MANPQDLWLELIKLSSFNFFDGERVVEDLKANRELWDSAIMLGNEGILLRDLPKGIHNVDTLYILTDKRRVKKLLEVVEGWEYDNIYMLEGEEAMSFLGFWSSEGTDKVVVVLWWD